MNKTLVILGCLSIGMVQAQKTGRDHSQHDTSQGRVGINTETPVATLEISKVTGVPATQVQGFLLPQLTQAERNGMAKDALVNGLMIFNRDKNCIDWWNGTNWQCTDGTDKDEHGEEYKKTFTGSYTYPATTRNFTRNNCVAPQIGTSVSYTSTAITMTATSKASQTDADEKAKQAALAEFERLGQVFANTNGTCKSSEPDTSSITIPSGITISDSRKIIASIYDTNYLPFTAPTAGASWDTNVNPDAEAEKTIDVQGKITTTGITVEIPVNATTGGTLPAYKTYVRIPAERTQDGVERTLELSWGEQAFTNNTKNITATIKSLDGDLLVKKLDINSGLGSNYDGVELGTFRIPQSNADGAVPANYKGRYVLRAISGIPDKNINNVVEGENRHQFVYIPVTGPDGKLWLNNNLGADYSNIASPHFDPTKQAESVSDYKAYGSLFQFGRDGDGHELINWTASDKGSAVIPSKSWTSNNSDSLSYTKENDPCPSGWRVPTLNEYTLIKDLIGETISDHKGLHFPFAGSRNYMGGATFVAPGKSAFIWSSTASVNIRYSHYLILNGTSKTNSTTQAYRSIGASVRCIKE